VKISHVEEIVLRRHIGQIDTVAMMRRLASFGQWVPRGSSGRGCCPEVPRRCQSGAGKSSALGTAVDVDSKLVIDPAIAKERLARWCVAEGVYDRLLPIVLPDGGPIMPLELSDHWCFGSAEVKYVCRGRIAGGWIDGEVSDGSDAFPLSGTKAILMLGNGYRSRTGTEQDKADLAE